MLAPAENAVTITTWLADFESALAESDEILLGTLFHRDSHWRDVLALTWSFKTINGRDAIVNEFCKLDGVQPTSFRLAMNRAPPRYVSRAAVRSLEAIFTFETVEGRCNGVLRLTREADDSSATKAWTLLTALDEIKESEGQLENPPPKGDPPSRSFRGPNWLDRRKTAAAYAEHDPAVLVVGGGQAGLSAAACLRQLGVDTLIVDREARIGDNWRKRYHALVLHNQTHVNHLPYLKFPASWPTYLPKDKVAGWFEAYAESMELNLWTGTEFVGGTYDEENGRWSVMVRRSDGSEREMHPRHVVMATGESGIPNLPDIPTLHNFAGSVLHSSQYQTGESWRGKNVLVIGTGTSGHDVAQDLHANGASVTLVQRSPTMVVNVEPGAQLPYELYEEGPSLEDCDLIATSMPFSVAKRSHTLMTRQAKRLDRHLLEGLESRGFRLDFGEDETGWQFKYLTRGGGYYFNVGCSDLIVSGEVGLIQFSDIANFVAEGACMRGGQCVEADLIVLATGYKGQEHLVSKLFGNEVAARVGPIWGFGDGEELRNMYTSTAQSGLWFIAGSFAQCRIYSKYLGLNIKARETSLVKHEHHKLL